MQRTAPRLLLPIYGALLISAFILPNSASAQGLCSGRCLVNPVTLEPYCSLSLFGTRICVEGVDYCAEFACPDGATAGEPETTIAGRCQQVPSTLLSANQALNASAPESTIQVIALKDRS